MNLDKNIPIPNKMKIKYPLAEMEIGDSFLIESTDKKKKNSIQSNIKSLSYRYRPKEFTTRNVPEGIRIWRTL